MLSSVHNNPLIANKVILAAVIITTSHAFTARSATSHPAKRDADTCVSDVV